MVLYTDLGTETLFNLAFGDYDDYTGDLDDLSISDNKDTQQVLATVASTLVVFLEKHPTAWVVAEGSTKARTRLYRMGISKHLKEISKEFAIFGYLISKGWEPFASDKNYKRFMITNKQNLQHYEE